MLSSRLVSMTPYLFLSGVGTDASGTFSCYQAHLSSAAVTARSGRFPPQGGLFKRLRFGLCIVISNLQRLIGSRSTLDALVPFTAGPYRT